MAVPAKPRVTITWRRLDAEERVILQRCDIHDCERRPLDAVLVEGKPLGAACGAHIEYLVGRIDRRVGSLTPDEFLRTLP